MATRIKCSFCDYVMNIPDAALREAAPRGRLEWMCLGCGSPIIVEPPLSAAESALGAPPPELSSARTASVPRPATSRVKSVLSPERDPVERDHASSLSAMASMFAKSPEAPNVAELPKAPEAIRLPEAATPPEVPKSKDTQPALGAPPPPAHSWTEHSAPRRTIPPPPPPPAARRTSSLPPPPLEAFGVARSRPSAPPPLPLAVSNAHTAHQASGVQLRADELTRVTGATPPPVEVHRSLPSGPRASGDQSMIPTQRSTQAPRWIYGALAAIALGSGAAGYLLRQPQAAPSASLQSGETQEAKRGAKPAKPLHPSTLTGKNSARVVAATYATPGAQPTSATPTALAPAAPAAVGAPAAPAVLGPAPKHREASSKKTQAPAAENGTQPPAASAPASDGKPGAEGAPVEPASATATAAGTPLASEKVVLEEEAAPPPPAEPFDKEAARIALDVAGARAQSCRKANDPNGMARITVVFAPSGRVTSATVSGAPYAGTEVGSCLATAFRGASIPAYAGSPVTVAKTVVIR